MLVWDGRLKAELGTAGSEDPRTPSRGGKSSRSNSGLRRGERSSRGVEGGSCSAESGRTTSRWAGRENFLVGREEKAGRSRGERVAPEEGSGLVDLARR